MKNESPEKKEKLTTQEIIQLKKEQEAIEADYQDWIYRHWGGYTGDYWED